MAEHHIYSANNGVTGGLKRAITAASNGDTIYLHYRLEAFYYFKNYAFDVDKELTIIGVPDSNTGDYPIIALIGLTYGPTITSGNVTLKRLHIRKFYRYNAAEGTEDYGIFISSLSDPVTLEQLHVEYTHYSGGVSKGIYTGGGSATHVFNNVTVLGFNKSLNLNNNVTGKHIVCEREALYYQTLTIDYCAFANLTAVGGSAILNETNPQTYAAPQMVSQSGIIYSPDALVASTGNWDIKSGVGYCGLASAGSGLSGPTVWANGRTVTINEERPANSPPNGNNCFCMYFKPSDPTVCLVWSCCKVSPHSTKINAVVRINYVSTTSSRIVILVGYDAGVTHGNPSPPTTLVKATVGVTSIIVDAIATRVKREAVGVAEVGYDYKYYLLEFTTDSAFRASNKLMYIDIGGDSSDDTVLFIHGAWGYPTDDKYSMRGLSGSAYDYEYLVDKGDPDTFDEYHPIVGGLLGTGTDRSDLGARGAVSASPPFADPPHFNTLSPTDALSLSELTSCSILLSSSHNSQVILAETVIVSINGTLYTEANSSDTFATLAISDYVTGDPSTKLVSMTFHQTMIGLVEIMFEGADASYQYATPFVASYYVYGGTDTTPYDILDGVIYEDPAFTVDSWEHCYDVIDVNYAFGPDIEGIIYRGISGPNKKSLSINNPLIQLRNLAGLVGDNTYQVLRYARKTTNCNLTFQIQLDPYDTVRYPIPTRYYPFDRTKIWALLDLTLQVKQGILEIKGVEKL